MDDNRNWNNSSASIVAGSGPAPVSARTAPSQAAIYSTHVNSLEQSEEALVDNEEGRGEHPRDGSQYPLDGSSLRGVALLPITPTHDLPRAHGQTNPLEPGLNFLFHCSNPQI